MEKLLLWVCVQCVCMCTQLKLIYGGCNELLYACIREKKWERETIRNVEPNSLFFFAVGVLPLESVLLVSVRMFFNVSLSSNAGNNKHWYRAFRRQSSLRWTSIYIRIQAISHTILLLKIYKIFFVFGELFRPCWFCPFRKIHYFQFDFAIFTWCIFPALILKEP